MEIFITEEIYDIKTKQSIRTCKLLFDNGSIIRELYQINDLRNGKLDFLKGNKNDYRNIIKEELKFFTDPKINI